MRYIPNVTTTIVGSFEPSQRPPMDQIPAALAKLVKERDRLADAVSAASTRVAELAGDDLDQQAAAADAEAAARAARAGKAIPPAGAADQLAKDRDEAARALQAQRAALDEVVNEAEHLRGHLADQQADNRAERLAAAREHCTDLATALADAVEAAVREGAVEDWLRNGRYHPGAQTWPTEVADLARYGQTRENTSPEDVRAFLTRAATAALTDD